jgi:N-acyl-D-amino-acid deacylase
MLDRLETPTTRSTIVTDLKHATLHYDRYIVANSVTPGSNGLTIADISEKTGEAPEEIILSLLAANRGKVSVFGKTLSMKNIEAGLKHPLAIMASDGSGVSGELGKAGVLVHPRSTGAFPHFLHRFVREKQIVSWEEGIRKITSLPAEVVGFPERGRLESGYHADVVVFDPEVIRDRSTYHSPYVHPIGIEAVSVNGKLAIEEGELTGSASGQVLKKS